MTEYGNRGPHKMCEETCRASEFQFNVYYKELNMGSTYLLR